MGIVSKSTILGWLPFASDEAITQVSNLLESFFHKAEGKAVKNITELNGYTTITFSDDSSQTFAKKEIIDVLIANQTSGFIARKNRADLPAVGDADTAYLVLDDTTDNLLNGTWGFENGAYYQAKKDAETLARIALNEDLGNKIALKEDISAKTTTKEKIYDDVNEYFDVTDANGNVIAKIDSNGLNSTKYNLLNSNGDIVGVFNSDLLAIIAAKVNQTDNDIALNLKEDKSATSTVKDFIIDTDGKDFDVTDENGNVIFNINKGGVSLTDIISKSDEINICDEQGFVMFKISNTGVEYFGKNTGGSVTNEVIEGSSLADVVQVIVYGQSLSIGGWADSAIDFYNTKTFTGNIRTNYDPDDTVARDAYYGSGFIPLPSNGADTPGKGFVRAYKDTIASLNGISVENQDFELLVNAPGAGGIPLSDCANVNGIYYRRLIESVQYAHNFALVEGKTHVVGALTFWQGESSSDTFKTEQVYFNECTAMFTSLNTDIKAITGQNFDVNFIVYQVATYTNNDVGQVGVALAFLKMARELPNVTLAPVMYPYTYTDGFHTDRPSTRIGGACAGIAAAKTIFNGEKPTPMYPTSHFISSNSTNTLWSLRVEIPVMVSPLVVDITTVSEATNYGFSIKNIGDTEIITSVKVSRNAVTIITNEDPTGLLLTYCITGVAEPGNIRDSQDYQINHDGTNYEVYNWLPMFQYQL